MWAELKRDARRRKPPARAERRRRRGQPFCVPPRLEPRVFDAVLEQPLDTSWGGFQKQVLGFQAAHSQAGAGAKENRGDQTIVRVEEWLERVDGSWPPLLWVHFIDPHTPDNCPEPFPQTYAGEVEFVDAMAGRLVDGWDAKLGAADTLSVITADHGEHLDDHGVERGHGTLWITNLRTPLLTRCPGLIETGTVGDELTRQIDVLPTVLDYCAVPLPSDVLGMSLRQHISTIAA